MNYEPTDTRYEGPHGTAERIELPDRPDAAETVCSWLLTAPGAFAFWSQYALFVVRLREGVPGFPDPKLRFHGATHELDVVALDPDRGPHTIASLIAPDAGLSYLMPVNVSEQFTATDDEMAQLAALAAQAVVHGVLCPETGLFAGIAEIIRHHWLTVLVRTLAHIRGEEHAG